MVPGRQIVSCRNKCNHKNYLSSNASLGSNDAQNLFRDEKYVPGSFKLRFFGEGEKSHFQFSGILTMGI